MTTVVLWILRISLWFDLKRKPLPEFTADKCNGVLDDYKQMLKEVGK